MPRRTAAVLDRSSVIWFPLVVLGGGIALAAAAQVQPLIVVALLAGVIVLALAWPRRTETLPRIFLYALGGLLLGVIESLASGYIGELTGGVLGSNYRDVFAFLVLILVLVFRPSGIMGQRGGDRA